MRERILRCSVLGEVFGHLVYHIIRNKYDIIFNDFVLTKKESTNDPGQIVEQLKEEMYVQCCKAVQIQI